MTDANQPSDIPLDFDSFIEPVDSVIFTIVTGKNGSSFGWNIYVNTGGLNFHNLSWGYDESSGLRVKRDDPEGNNRVVFLKSSGGFDSREDAVKGWVDYLFSIGAIWYDKA